MSIQQLTFNAPGEQKAGQVTPSWSLEQVTFAVSITVGYICLTVCFLGMARLIAI